jgi:hypothetical protein
MTILHNDEPQSMKGVYPESHNCIDYGYNTALGCPPRALAEFLMNRDGNVPMPVRVLERVLDSAGEHVRNNGAEAV